MQAAANAQSSQVSAQAEVEKNLAITQSKAELAQIEAQLEIQRMGVEVASKKELMEQEFQYNMQLRCMEVEGTKDREKEKEDRKDRRTKIQATQQSELIDQRKNEKPPKNFESSGNDIMGGGFDLGAFEPK